MVEMMKPRTDTDLGTSHITITMINRITKNKLTTNKDQKTKTRKKRKLAVLTRGAVLTKKQQRS